MVFDLHAENVNKIDTASRFFVIKNKVKNPCPASNFLGRPAKPVINFTWPKKVFMKSYYYRNDCGCV